MIRRTYIAGMLCALVSCGKFNVSPYVFNTPNTHLNNKHVSRIQGLDSDAGENFKVAVISDTHNYYKELKEQIAFINRRRAEYDFVIVGGDLTNLGLLREFEAAKKIFQDLRIPYVSAVGNHDLLSNGSLIFEQMFGPSDFSFVFKQSLFVFFNNNNWESSGMIPDLDFVRGALADGQSANNKIMIGHVAPDDKDRWDEEEKAEMREIVDDNSVDYFLNGHDHNPGDGRFGTATRVTIGASNKGKILELEISPSGGVSHRFLDF